MSNTFKDADFLQDNDVMSLLDCTDQLHNVDVDDDFVYSDSMIDLIDDWSVS